MLGELRNFLKTFMQRPKELEVKLLGRKANANSDANANGNGNPSAAEAAVSDNGETPDAPAPAAASGGATGEGEIVAQDDLAAVVDEGVAPSVGGSAVDAAPEEEYEASSPSPTVRTRFITDDEVAQAEAAALAARMFADMSPLTAARRTSSK